MWCLMILLFVEFANGLKLTDPVNTPIGQIRGVSAEDGTYSKFLGIPFAEVNRKNPFGISTPHPGFDSVFDATNDTIVACPQRLDDTPNSLDCLNMNIYVPNNAGGKMPVLIWIYGGIFQNGYAGLYDDERFIVRHDVIFISFNYRVGPYGFMCLDTEEVPGNQGLRDQYLAIKWVHDNIGAFGGDPSKITIMGESSGAMTVDLHLLSEQPKFFNQAIMQSGTAHYPDVIMSSNKTVPILMAKYLGFSTSDITEALTFLAGASPESVIRASEDLVILLRPCVEKKFPSIQRFLSIHPDHNTHPVQLKNISIIIGGSDGEGIMIKSLMSNNILYKQSQTAIFRDCLNKEFDTAQMSTMIDKIRRFYIGDKEIKLKDDEVTDFLSDYFIIYPTQRALNRYIETGARVYQYLFAYDGDRNYIKLRLKIDRKGASHGDDLGYLFNMTINSKPITAPDQLIIDRMTAMWTNFAKYGNPIPETSEILPVTWPRVTEDVGWYYQIDTNLTVDSGLHHRRMAFWDLFYDANRDKLWSCSRLPRKAAQLKVNAYKVFNPR